MPVEQVLTLGLALGGGVLASALARRMTGQAMGYLLYVGVQLVAMLSGFVYLYLAHRGAL